MTRKRIAGFGHRGGTGISNAELKTKMQATANFTRPELDPDLQAWIDKQSATMTTNIIRADIFKEPQQ